MKIHFIHKRVTETDKAILQLITNEACVWMPKRFRLETGEYDLPDDFKFVVNNPLDLSENKIYYGVEICEQYMEAIELTEEPANSE